MKNVFNRIALSLIASSFSIAALAQNTTFATLTYPNPTHADYVSVVIHEAGTISGSRVEQDGQTTVGVMDPYGRPFLAKGFVYNCVADFDGRSAPISGAFYFLCNQDSPIKNSSKVTINFKSNNGINPMPNSASVLFTPAQVLKPAH